MTTLTEHVRNLHLRLAEVERRDRNRSRIGTVKEVNPAKGLARVDIGPEQGKPMLTGWIPWQEQAAGTARTHWPPSVGQQVRVRSQNGDLTDAEIEWSLPSDINKRTSQKGNEYVICDVGAARVFVDDGGDLVEARVGGSYIRIEDGRITIHADEVVVTGGSLRHNHANVGDSHVHGGIYPGPANTDVPAN